MERERRKLDAKLFITLVKDGVCTFGETKNEIKILKFLVQEGCDINGCNIYGFTALHVMIWKDYNFNDLITKQEYLDMVDLLLTKGADFGKEMYFRSKTPSTTPVLDFVMDNKNYQVAWLLIKHGAAVYSFSQGSGGHFSSKKSHLYEMVKSFYNHVDPTTAYSWYEMLSSLGYPIDKEEWITKKTSSDYKDHVDFLRKQQTRILSLKKLSILSIRKAMVVSSGHSSILGNIEKLKLHTSLKQDLTLEGFSPAANIDKNTLKKLSFRNGRAFWIPRFHAH